MPGKIRGNVTVQNVVTGVAPRSLAASSRDGSKPDVRAFTVTTTYEIENSTWAMTMVRKPRDMLTVTKRASKDTPNTTPGVAMGRKTNRFRADRPRKRWRLNAS